MSRDHCPISSQKLQETELLPRLVCGSLRLSPAHGGIEEVSCDLCDWHASYFDPTIEFAHRAVVQASAEFVDCCERSRVQFHPFGENVRSRIGRKETGV